MRLSIRFIIQKGEFGQIKITQGFAEELPQSVTETILSNIANDEPWDTGLDESASLGLVTGMVMGGMFQAVVAADT